ncbi:hypothetical protein [Aeromonas veronii]|uniref:hypothetical protein n=1 Tax=Aeromonas veronii TaxID=654 RepID=UPI003007C945|nr:hypothetical protein [Aeromonas veronii]
MVSKYSGELYYEAISQDKLVFETFVIRGSHLSIQGYELSASHGRWEFNCQAECDATDPSLFLSTPFRFVQSGVLSDKEWQLKLTLSGNTECDPYLELMGEIFNKSERGFLEGEIERISN